MKITNVDRANYRSYVESKVAQALRQVEKYFKKQQNQLEKENLINHGALEIYTRYKRLQKEVEETKAELQSIYGICGDFEYLISQEVKRTIENNPIKDELKEIQCLTFDRILICREDSEANEILESAESNISFLIKEIREVRNEETR